jgi:hypothetical protein
VEIICLQGEAPGPIVAVLSHGAQLRQVPMTVLRHPAGGWRVAQRGGGFGPRCHAVPTAVLLEASGMFISDEIEMSAP